MEEVVLQVQDLCVELQVDGRRVKAVDNLSFMLEKGKTTALVGESGCGKTMSALSLLRILPPAALPPTGSVIYKNIDLLRLSEGRMRSLRGRKLAMIFQDPTGALNPVYTIGDQLLEAVTLHMSISEEEAYHKVLAAMEEVGMPSAAERYEEYPHQLSGGLKQRAMIAMALCCEPDILLADEPTTALDVTIQAQVLELIRHLQAQRGMSLLLITHDMGVVAEMADQVVVMYASQAVEQGPVQDIFDNMAHPYTKGLFESRPHAFHRRGQLHSIKGMVPSLGSYPSGCHFHPRCPYAMEKCKTGPVPNFVMQSNSKHVSRCWLHDGSAESHSRLLQIGGLHANAFA